MQETPVACRGPSRFRCHKANTSLVSQILSYTIRRVDTQRWFTERLREAKRNAVSNLSPVQSLTEERFQTVVSKINAVWNRNPEKNFRSERRPQPTRVSKHSPESKRSLDSRTAMRKETQAQSAVKNRIAVSNSSPKQNRPRITNLNQIWQFPLSYRGNQSFKIWCWLVQWFRLWRGAKFALSHRNNNWSLPL